VQIWHIFIEIANTCLKTVFCPNEVFTRQPPKPYKFKKNPDKSFLQISWHALKKVTGFATKSNY